LLLHYLVIALSCSHDSYSRTIRIHGKADSNTPIETSRIWWRQNRYIESC